jgi:hypothetical protein
MPGSPELVGRRDRLTRGSTELHSSRTIGRSKSSCLVQVPSDSRKKAALLHSYLTIHPFTRPTHCKASSITDSIRFQQSSSHPVSYPLPIWPLPPLNQLPRRRPQRSLSAQSPLLPARLLVSLTRRPSRRMTPLKVPTSGSCRSKASPLKMRNGLKYLINVFATGTSATSIRKSCVPLQM